MLNGKFSLIKLTALAFYAKEMDVAGTYAYEGGNEKENNAC